MQTTNFQPTPVVVRMDQTVVGPMVALHSVQGIQVSQIRECDGYVDAARLCKAASAQFDKKVEARQFLQTKRSIERLAKLAPMLTATGHDMVKSPLVQKVGAKILIHPRVALDYFIEWTQMQLDARAMQMIRTHAGLESSGVSDITISNLATLRDCSGKFLTEIRLADGYVDAYKMCKAAGHYVKDLQKQKRTKKFLEMLTAQLNVTTESLVEKNSKVSAYPGVWVHANMALFLAISKDIHFDNDAKICLNRYLIRDAAPFGDCCELDARARQRMEVANGAPQPIIDEVSATMQDQVRPVNGANTSTDMPTVVVSPTDDTEPAELQTSRDPNDAEPNALAAEEPTVQATAAVVEHGPHPVAASTSTPLSDAVLQALRGDDGEMITELRTSDGMVNATKICKSAGKQFTIFRRDGGDKFLQELAVELGMEVEVKNSKFCQQKGEHELTHLHKTPLIQVTHGGKYAGSWVHPRVALKLAEWCSVKFSVQINGIMYRYTEPAELQTSRDPNEAESNVPVAEETNAHTNTAVGESTPAPTTDPGLHALGVDDGEMMAVASAGVPVQPSMDSSVTDAVLQALRGDDGETITELRTSDGMVNGTKMCKSAGVQLKDFTRLAETRKFFTELAKDLGLEPSNSEKAGEPFRLQDSNEKNEKLLSHVPLHIIYPQLIQVTKGGKYAGSWVHPRVALKLAEWCSVKFSVQTNGIMYRYMQGEVTTEESQTMAATVAAATVAQPSEIVQTSQRALIAKKSITSHPIIDIDDIERHSSDDMVMGIPTCALSPNAMYLLDCGKHDKQMVSKYGWTASTYDRVPDLLRDHPGCKLLMLVLTGTHNAKVIEDTVKLYCRSHRLTLRVRGDKTLTECFKVPEPATEFFEKMRDLILATHDDIIDTVMFGNEFTSLQKDGQDTRVLLEIEKTKQAEADSAARQAEADSAARQAEANAQIRLAEIRFEMAKLGLDPAA